MKVTLSFVKTKHDNIKYLAHRGNSLMVLAFILETAASLKGLLLNIIFGSLLMLPNPLILVPQGSEWNASNLEDLQNRG